MKLINQLSLLTVLLTSLSGCSVVIPDEMVCVDEGLSGAHCAHTQTSETLNLTTQQWDSMKVGRFSVSASDYATNKAILEKLCHLSKACKYQKQLLLHLKELSPSPLDDTDDDTSYALKR